MPIREISIETSEGLLDATVTDADKPTHALLLAHGAGADHRHAHMTSLADAFAAEHMTVLRFNFPFKQHGRNRVDSKEVSINCICSAATWLQNNRPLPLLTGGHSFGGRMTTHAVAEGKLTCEALILCSFPLHPAGKPTTDRAAHLPDISPPMIFLSGTRDTLANQELLNSEVDRLDSPSCVHWLETGDHSFKILKRTRQNPVDIYREAALATRQFIDALQ